MTWVRILALAGCYYGVGRLSLLLAIPPGYATAFWPPSGIALAGLLLCGYRAWPGVLVGSFLVNVGTAFDPGSIEAALLAVALPLSIATGATLQAVVGALLVQRYVGFPNPLNQEQDVARLLLLAGPISCLINASIGVSTLWWTGKIHLAEAPFTWWTWWGGDTIGAFVVTPLVFMWNQPHPDWPRRALTVSIPLTVMAILVVILFVYTDEREQERMWLAFEFQTETLTRSVENRLDYVLEALNGMRTFHGKDPKPADQRKFSQAARTILARRTTVQAFTWTPRVKDTERDAFEQAGKEQNGPDFTIRELDAHHNLVPAKRRAEYYPILYREPQPDNPKAMGFDVASEADRLEALQRAGETAEPVASSPLTPKSPGNNNEATLLVFLPIYRDGIARDQPLDRRQTIRGYVIAVLRMGRLVELAWEGFNSEGIHFWLYDETSSSHKRFAFYRGSERGLSETLPSAEEMQALTTAIQRTTSIHAAGRQWTLRFVQTPQYLAAHRSLQAWSVLAGGMLFTGLLGGVLVVVTGRTALIAGLVKQRTTQLAEANAAMVQEIAQRHRLEQEVLEIAALEQRRIGQELHDGVGQELTGLCMLADDLAEVLGERSAEQAQMAHRIAQSLKSALAQVRALSRGLIPVEVDAEGLMAALTELTDRIGKLHDISCTFEYLEPVLVEDNFTATQLYRIAQEAITNALKHSKADNIRVSLEIRDRCLTLRIADDGIGLTELVKRLEGMGLHIMKYRASQIGAQLSIRPGPAGGTIVTCTLLRENECVERC